MPRLFPRLGGRVLALAVAILAITMFLPAEVAQAAAATHAVFTSPAGPVIADKDIVSYTVTMKDGNEFADIAYNGLVTFSAVGCSSCFVISTNSDLSMPLPNNQYQFQAYIDSGTKTFYVGWKEAAVGDQRKLHVSAPLNPTGTSAVDASPIQVKTNAPDYMTLDGVNSQATQNVSEQFTVKIRNARAEEHPYNYTGTMTFSATGCSNCFTVTPNNGGNNTDKYTFVAGDAGTKQFSLTWGSAGNNRTFTATGSNLPAINGPNHVTRSPISVDASSVTTTTSTTTTAPPTTTTTTAPPRPKAAVIVTGAAQGGGPHVIARLASDPSQFVYSFMAYDENFRGGVRVATGDVNNDGWDDIITAPGPGGGPDVKVFSGKDGGLLASFWAYDPAFAGGVFVATGDVNHDGHADIITGADADPHGAPHVKAFNGTNLTGTPTPLLSFFAYDAGVHAGVRVAANDFNNDGNDDIVTAPGAGGGPHVRVWSGTNGAELTANHGFFAYDPSFSGGVYLAAGTAQSPFIVTGAGAGGGRHVRVLDINGGSFRDFFADQTTTDGAIPAFGQVGSLANELFFVSKASGSPTVQRFSPTSGDPIGSPFQAYAATGIGVFVAVGVF